MNSLTASFYRFPRMQSIRPAAFPPPSPWGGGATSNPQWSNRLLQTGLCVAAVLQPIRNITIVYCNQVSAWRRCRSQFAILQSFIAIRFLRAAGNSSVSLRLPPSFHKGGFFVFLKLQRETVCAISQPLPQLGPGYHPGRSWVQDTTLAAAGSRVPPWWAQGTDLAPVGEKCHFLPVDLLQKNENFHECEINRGKLG